MAARFRRLAALLLPPPPRSNHHHSTSRSKTTSAQHVASRPMDPTFEKLMDGYKHLLKVAAVHDLVLASPSRSLPLPTLSSLSQKLRLNRGAPHFVLRYPHVFAVSYDPSAAQPVVRLTPAAAEISRRESLAAASAPMAAVERLERLLRMAPSRKVPLRAVFKVWRELGLPDDFEDSVISQNPRVFRILDNPREPNTHLLELIEADPSPNFSPAVEKWRNMEREKENLKVDEVEIRFGFKQGFPPGMKLSKNFRARVKEWQPLPYLGPYEDIGGGNGGEGGAKRSRARMKELEKRAVGIVHEFLSLTVEKMVEVEKVSHFRKWLGIHLNMRDLFLDHPGIFYLSTKRKTHTVFLREAYDRGCLIDPNPVYEARRKLLDLVLLGKRGVVTPDGAGGLLSHGRGDLCRSGI